MNWVTEASADDVFISFVWAVLLQITIVTLVVWTVVRMLGRSRPAVRQAVGRCGLAFVLLSPVLAWTLPQLGWRARWLPVERWWSEETTVSSALVSQEAGPLSVRLDPPRSAKPLVNPEARLPHGASAPAGVWAAALPRRATLRGIITLATGLWLVGILFLTGRWWHGYRGLKRVCWDLIPLDETACADVLVRVRQTLGISRLPEFRVPRNHRTTVALCAIRIATRADKRQFGGWKRNPPGASVGATRGWSHAVWNRAGGDP